MAILKFIKTTVGFSVLLAVVVVVYLVGIQMPGDQRINEVEMKFTFN